MQFGSLKLGHAAALACLLLALLTAPLAWWDLQDDYFSSRLLFVPVLGAVMALTFLLFPGGPATLREAQAPDTDFLPRWRAQLPPAHRRAWVAGAFLSIYLSLNLSDWLQGKAILTFSHQLLLLVVMGVLFLLLRHWMRQRPG